MGYITYVTDQRPGEPDILTGECGGVLLPESAGCLSAEKAQLLPV